MHARAKVICLPYLDYDFHSWGSSGRWQDALLMGAYPVSPASTAMSFEMQAFDPLLVPKSDSPKSVADAIISFLNQPRMLPSPTTLTDTVLWIGSETGTVEAGKGATKASNLVAFFFLLLAGDKRINGLELFASDLACFFKLLLLKRRATLKNVGR